MQEMELQAALVQLAEFRIMIGGPASHCSTGEVVNAAQMTLLPKGVHHHSQAGDHQTRPSKVAMPHASLRVM